MALVWLCHDFDPDKNDACLIGDERFYMVGVEAGVAAELVKADVLPVLLLVVLPDLRHEAAGGTPAYSGDALGIGGVDADTFYFHVRFVGLFSAANLLIILGIKRSLWPCWSVWPQRTSRLCDN